MLLRVDFFINCGKMLTVSMVTWTSKHYHGYCEHLSMLTVSSRSLLVSSINTRPALAFPFSGLLIAWDRAAALSHGEHDFSKLIFHCYHAGASTRTRSVTHTGSWPLVWGSTSSAVTQLSWLLLRQLMYKHSAAQLTSSEAETLMSDWVVLCPSVTQSLCTLSISFSNTTFPYEQKMLWK